MWSWPRPWMPATATRMVSLAPITRPDDLVPAMVTSGKAAAAAAPLRKLRRVIGRMAGPLTQEDGEYRWAVAEDRRFAAGCQWDGSSVGPLPALRPGPFIG